MSLIICPGIHPPDLTTGLLAGLENVTQTPLKELTNYFVFPSDRYPPYSAFHILEMLHVWVGKPCKNSNKNLKQADPDLPTNLLPVFSNTSLVFLSFSAGVVGAIGAARTWQRSGGRVKAFIAVDGWGVPLRGEFPLYRLSHDFFTHWSSAPLGRVAESFYADPPVSHLELWRSPQTVLGHPIEGEERSPFRFSGSSARPPITAAAFLVALLTRYRDLA